MKRCLVAFAVVMGLASAAAAATITMVPDQPVYSVGDTVTITFTGDGQGGSTPSIYARFSYAPSILSADPDDPLVVRNGIRECGGGLCEAFDDAIPPFPPPSTLFVSTVVFLAVAPGTTNLHWDELDFFGLTSDPGTTATVTVVPEPTTAALLAAGLLALSICAAGGRSATPK